MHTSLEIVNHKAHDEQLEPRETELERVMQCTNLLSDQIVDSVQTVLRVATACHCLPFAANRIRVFVPAATVERRKAAEGGGQNLAQ